MVDPSLLNESGKFEFVPQVVAAKISSEHRFATHRQSHVIWVYGNGCYSDDGEEVIRAGVRGLLGDEAKENRVNEVVAHIRETTYTPPEQFLPPVALLNFKNGILNIETYELGGHTPDVIFTNELPVEYHPGEKCPKIMKFLSEILHQEDIPVVQEVVGYCLLRDYRFAKAVMLLGEGSNGKSTLLNLISALLGEKNVATPALQDLIYNRFAKATLYGKLANIHADIPNIRLRHTGVFKMATGQDILWADIKQKRALEFRNYAKLLYSANELPQTDDMSEAFWRRWIVINFPNRFPEGGEGTDPDILQKLTTPEELSGFLNWAIEGLKRLLKQGHFTMTKTRGQIEEEWVTRSDSLRAFVMKHATSDINCFVTNEDFYTSYQDFCSSHDIPAIEKAMVGRRLPTLVNKVITFHTTIGGKVYRAWKGIRLSEPYESTTHITDMRDKLSYFCEKLSKNTKDIDFTPNTRNDVTPTASELKTRLFEIFGALPFKPSQIPEHFQGDELVKVNNLLTGEMLERGEVMQVPLATGEYAWQLVMKG